MEAAQIKAIENFLTKYPNLKEIINDRNQLKQFLEKNPDISLDFMEKLANANNSYLELIDEINSISEEDIDVAIVKCQHGVLKFPNEQHIFYKKISQLFEANEKYTDSITYAKKAIETTPKEIEDYQYKIFWLQMNIFDCYMKLKEWEMAYSLIDDIILPSPDYKYSRGIKKVEVLIKLEFLELANLIVWELIDDISPKVGSDYMKLYDLYSFKLRISTAANLDEDSINKDREKMAEYSYLMLQNW